MAVGVGQAIRAVKDRCPGYQGSGQVRLRAVHAGVSIFRTDGIYCFGTNTILAEVEATQEDDAEITVDFQDIPLQRGGYYLVVGLFGKPKAIAAYAQHVATVNDKLLDNMLAVFTYPKAIASVKSSAVEVEGLDRRLVDKRIWPAIDINKSGTRREEILMDPEEFRRVTIMRRVLADMNPPEAMELLVTRIAKTKTNAEFLNTLNLT